MKNQFDIRKIYYIANMRVPTEKAHGYQIFQMCQSFLNADLDVELVIPSRNNTNELKNNKDVKSYYNLDKVPSIKKLFSIDLISKTTGKGQIFSNLFHSLTFAVSLILYFLLKSPKNCSIYLRDPILLGLIASILKFRGHQLTLEMHSISETPSRYKKQLDFISKANKLVTMTEIMREKIIQDGNIQIPSLSSHDAVDFQKFDLPVSREQAREKLKLPQEKTIISFIGKFHTNGMEKGIPEILEAAKYILKEFPQVLFYFVGGPLEREEKYRRLIKELALKDENFVFIAKRPVQEVPLFLKASNILMMPHPDKYFYRYCVSPLKLFEYMSSKTPIVASDLPTISEVLVNEKDAMLAKAGDAQEIATKTISILADENLAHKLSQNSFEKVKHLTWDNRAIEIKQFLTL
jgi:glycosyltransferase involved in cell wall biosynthesis